MGSSIKTFFTNIKYKDSLSQLIIINVMIFLVLAIFRVFFLLFEIQTPEMLKYFEMSSSADFTIRHIWILFTYMFLHYDLFHILFNMLMLYWFGQLFLTYFTSKNLLSLYILGGLAGALFYLLVFNTVPYFIRMNPSSMIGASASVMAIIFGLAFYNKNLEVSMLLLGRVKIIYIAAFIFVLDFIALGGSSNQGGHVAHIGGALLGYLFAMQYRKGKDITKWINSLFDKIVNLFKHKSSIKVSHRNKDKRQTSTKSTNDLKEIDIILDKIKQSGYNSLNKEEKKRLFDASNK